MLRMNMERRRLKRRLEAEARQLIYAQYTRAQKLALPNLGAKERAKLERKRRTE